MVQRTLVPVPLLVVVVSLFLLSSCLVYRKVEKLDDDSHHSLFGVTSHQSHRGFSDPEVEEKMVIEPRSQRAKYDLDLKVDDPSVMDRIVEDKLRTLQRLETVDPNLPYDIHKCPWDIPKGYPVHWNIVDVLSHWNPDDTEIPSQIYQGLCTVDWRDPEQRRIAVKYRSAEVPFLIHHHPEVYRTAERWSHYDYMEKMLEYGNGEGETNLYRNEHSLNNHMPYWKLPGRHKGPKGWEPPTEMVQLSFPDWYKKATELEQQDVISDKEHYYFRFGCAKDKDTYLYNELPMFRPKKSFFMVDPSDERGINCRLGSKGIIAELHFDVSRNFIFILHGSKRYILAHPDQCQNLELHPRGHPSARHSRVNWSDPNDWHTGRFSNAIVNEVVLQAGDALYLPTSWFHFIVSLNLNYQCNARSGITRENEHHLEQCGF